MGICFCINSDFRDKMQFQDKHFEFTFCGNDFGYAELPDAGMQYC